MQIENYLIECPKCSHFLIKAVISGGGTYGAEVYSDGKIFAPMFNDPIRITKCVECNNFFWVNTAREVCKLERWYMFNDKYEGYNSIGFLNLEEYLHSLENNIFQSIEEEIYILIRIWWKFNDIYRYNGPPKYIGNGPNEAEIISATHLLNRREDILTSLLGLLKMDSQEDVVMMAELNRNLGHFDECKTLINEITDENLIWLVGPFIAECKKKNAKVFELTN